MASWWDPYQPRHSNRRLIIIPDGELHLVPWDSLVDTDGRYLVISHVVTTAPSAMVLYLHQNGATTETHFRLRC